MERQGGIGEVGRGYDLVVIGGTLSGCFSALHAARKGLRVLLVERRTFLATEIAATLRPWLRREGFEELTGDLKELFLPDEESGEVGVPFDPADSPGPFGDEIPLFCGSVKKQFMAILLREGVHVLVMTGVWGILTDGEGKRGKGVALASKFGFQVARCGSIIDATGGGAEEGGRSEYSFSLEFYGVAEEVEPEIAVPEEIGLLDDSLFVHRGKRMPGQRFLEFRFAASRDEAEQEARSKAEAICAHLIGHHPAFARAHLAQMAWETLETVGGRAAVEWGDCDNYFSGQPIDTRGLSCGDILDIDVRAGGMVADLPLVRNQGERAEFILHDAGRIPLDQCAIEPIDDVRLEYDIEKLSFAVEQYLPDLTRVDVVVAGGGTAGAAAGMAALRKGAKVVTAECFAELGGTRTLGRVTGYYWGYKDTVLHDRIEEDVKELGRHLGGTKARAPAIMLYLRKQAIRKGGILLTNSIICGVVKEKGRVAGIVVERGGRLTVLRGDVVVDATGDGDVAVFAGAAWSFGNRRMNATQNYSQWDLNPGTKGWKDSSTNRDHDILLHQYLSEFQRGYQLTHREAHFYDFSPMLTVREGRRIEGEYTITLRDVIEGRRHADAICLAHSDYDPHYFGDTALTKVGCLPPHGISAVVEIPYRALIPRGIGGLLVSAKAISQTHSAMQFTRMAFDVTTLGYVSGWIAALACEKGTDPRDFEVGSLQSELAEWRIIPADRPDGSECVELDGDRAAQRIDALMAGEENSLIKVLALPRELAEPALRERFESIREVDARLRLAKGLAWFGDRRGNAHILEEMEVLFAEEKAAGSLPWENYRKDQDSHYWTINQDIGLLGMSGDREVLPAILSLADSLKLGNPPARQETAYYRGRIDLGLIPYYNRIIIICFAIESMPDGAAIPTLHRFLDDPYIGGKVTRRPEMARGNLYGGILESRIAATLARCGDERGFGLLVDYLEDVHYLLAQYACRELDSLLGDGCGYDVEKRRAYIAGLKFPLEPMPRPPDEVEW